MKKTKTRITSTILLSLGILAGIGLVLFGINEKRNMDATDKYYMEAAGTVIGHNESYDTDDGYTYASIVEYQVNGNCYQVSQEIYSNYMESIGKEHRVMYHPNDPSTAYIKSGLRSYWLIIFVGAFFIAVLSVILVSLFDKKQTVVKLLLSVLLVIMGVCILYFCRITFDTLNPFRAPASLIGYIFLLVSGICFISCIQEKKRQHSGLEEWEEGKDFESGILVCVEEIIPLLEDEKKILFRSEKGEEVYYTYHTNSQGYFEEGKDYIICVPNLQEQVAAEYENGRKIYDLAPLALPFTKFVSEYKSRTIANPAENFYENNKDEMDKVLEVVNTRVMPAAKKIENGARIAQKVVTIFVLLLFMCVGIFAMYSSGNIENNWGLMCVGAWFILLPLIIFIEMFDGKKTSRKCIVPMILFILGYGAAGFLKSKAGTWNPIQNPWILVGYGIMAAAVFMVIRVIINRCRKRVL